MRLIGNLLWLVISGIALAVAYWLTGIVMFLLIVAIPFGVQAFKLAGYALWPFGRVVVQRAGGSPAASCLGNFLWIFLAGIWLALAHALAGALFMITVIGIPFGVAHFKLAGLALTPFGAEVVDADAARGRRALVEVSPLGG